MAKEKQVIQGNLQSTLDYLNKSYGQGTILPLDGKLSSTYDVISTGSIGFDWITLGVGGFVKGKLYELMGWEGCLTGDTFIKFRTISKNNKQNHKGGTLLTLYEKFNNLPLTGYRKKVRKDIQECKFSVQSINEQGFIVHSMIKDVVYSGIHPIYEVKTAMGYSIKATITHRFYTGTSWSALYNFKVGDTVYIHNRTTFKKDDKQRKNYDEVNVKYHPKWSKRYIEGKYEFYRAHKSRAVIEADMNHMEYVDYIKFLNTAQREDIDKLIFIPDDHDVHHIDENINNNVLSNLVLLPSKEHSRYHSTNSKNKNNLNFVAIPDSIISIEYVGEDKVYDIVCEEPFRNFVANNIVVHNSGKSTICGHAIAECQKIGGRAAYIDGEHALDKKYFMALGVDTSEMLISQPSNGEEGFDIAAKLIQTGEIDLLVIDSDSSLIPKSVVDGEVGDSAIGKKARLNNNIYPKLKALLSKNNVCVIVVSQYREKIGVMFGNPTTTQGGHALKFYTDCRLEVSKSLARNGDDTYGNITKVTATKNKMASPFNKCEFEIIYGEGIDKIKEVVELGAELGVITRSGSWYSYGETKIGQGAPAVKALLADNPELYDEIYEKLINKIKET